MGQLWRQLDAMGDEVVAVNLAKGWYDQERTFGEDVALLHSEVSEMLEAYRKWGTEDGTIDKDTTLCTPKPEGVGSEAADVLIRLLDTCHRYGINLYAEYRRKMDYNQTRPYRHGGKRL